MNRRLPCRNTTEPARCGSPFPSRSPYSEPRQAEGRSCTLPRGHVGPTFQSVIPAATEPSGGPDPPAGRQEVRPPDFFDGLLILTDSGDTILISCVFQARRIQGTPYLFPACSRLASARSKPPTPGPAPPACRHGRPPDETAATATATLTPARTARTAPGALNPCGTCRFRS